MPALRPLRGPFAVLLLCCGALQSNTAAAGDASVQLLVTVPIEASADLGPGRDFRRPPRYGGGPRTDVLLDGLAREHGLQRRGGWPIHALSVYCAVFELDGNGDPGTVLAHLQADARVDSAQPMLLHRTRAAADRAAADDAAADYDDPMLPLQTGFATLRLGAAHALSRGAGTSIAVVDTGMDQHHPELRGRIVQRADFTGGKATGHHGTAVGGLIGARPDNGIGIVGVAPDAQLLDLRACWPDGDAGLQSVCSSLSLARALDAAVAARATVVSLALSGPDDPLLGRLIEVAVARGASVVAAASAKEAFPASRDDVVGAAATRDGPRLAEMRAVRVPAAGLITTFPGGGFDFVSGDSFAVAQVAGVIALMRARYPALTPDAVRSTLLAEQPLDAVALLQPRGGAIAAAH